ncbi:MAG: hypothetical protein V2A53_07830, partial [bacterium]
LQNGFFSEDVAGDYLFILGKGYFGQVGIMDEIGSSYIHLPFFKDICFANLFVEADVDYIFDMPYTMSIRGLSIDADRNICLVTGKQDKVRDFMTLSGYTSSVLEHQIWEKWYGEGAISAIKAIQIASEGGILVYDIDSSNVSIVDTFNIPSLAKQNIKNAINAGNIAKCPQSSISYKGWQGVGYIISDPETGEARYEIADISGSLFLATHPTTRPFQEYCNIEKDAIRFAINNPPSGDTDVCEAFANFAQDLANRFTDKEFQESYFLHALYDLSVYDLGGIKKDFWWYLGLLGPSGPANLRPQWLNKHNDGYIGSGFKLFVDPCSCWDEKLTREENINQKETGRKDHFVTNAVERDLALIFEALFWKEDCSNDSMYNFFGRVFGGEIYWKIIHRDEVGSRILKYLHPKEE